MSQWLLGAQPLGGNAPFVDRGLVVRKRNISVETMGGGGCKERQFSAYQVPRACFVLRKEEGWQIN